MPASPHGFDQWISRRNKLGDVGAFTGVPGAHGDGIAWAIGFQRNEAASGV